LVGTGIWTIEEVSDERVDKIRSTEASALAFRSELIKEDIRNNI
jgi:hypothetical protein